MQEAASPDEFPVPDKTSYRRVFSTVRRTLLLAWQASPVGFMILTALTIVSALVPPFVVALSRKVVDLIAAAGDPEISVSDILPWTVAMGILAATQRILTSLQNTRQLVYSWDVNLHAEHLFLVKASQTELARFDDPSWHDRVARVSQNVGYRPFNATYEIIGLTGSFVTVVGMLGVLLSLHPVLLLLALASVLIPMPFQRTVNRRLYQLNYNFTTMEREQVYYRHLLSDTRAAKDLRAFVLESHLLQRHRTLAENYQTQRRKLYRRADKVTTLTGLAGGLALAGAYVFVAFARQANSRREM